MKLPLSALLGLTYFVSEVLLTLTKRAPTKGPSRDAGSWRLLWIVIVSSMWLGVRFAHRYSFATLPHPELFSAIGVVIFAVGLVLRFYAIAHLGRFFTVNVAIAADHKLVESGPYRFIRHPSYTGSLLAVLGFALSLGNWLGFLVVIIPIFAVFVYRMNVEERALVIGLGDSYVSYIARTKRLFPFIY